VNPIDPLALKTQAHEVGFDLCGVATASRHPRLARIADWIARGSAGDMHYLTRTLDERVDPLALLSTARSVISVAIIYNTGQPYSTSVDSDRAAISRYAWGDDYHEVFRPRLRRLLAWLSEQAGPGLEALSSVDDGPVQERVFAEQAGLGWIGKNTCLINETLGSWFFLGAVITNAAIEPDDPVLDRCGACQRCLDACPTGAIVAPYEIDATRCLSYLTIEHRAVVPESLRPSIGRHIFGCDICQDVCPWNRRAVTSPDSSWQPRAGLAFPRLLDLCEMADADWSRLLRQSAMRRAGLHRIRRSLAYACRALPPHEGELALDRLAAHPSASDVQVADAIDWARREVHALRLSGAGTIPTSGERVRAPEPEGG
jgi:epoxyqueuosine reductase